MISDLSFNILKHTQSLLFDIMITLILSMSKLYSLSQYMWIKVLLLRVMIFEKTNESNVSMIDTFVQIIRASICRQNSIECNIRYCFLVLNPLYWWDLWRRGYLNTYLYFTTAWCQSSWKRTMENDLYVFNISSAILKTF